MAIAATSYEESMGLDLRHLERKVWAHKARLEAKGERIDLYRLAEELGEIARHYYARLPRAISAEHRFSAR